MEEEICFNSYYGLKDDQFYTAADDFEYEKDPKFQIKDCYRVTITQEDNGAFKAYEGGRIKKFAEANKICVYDLHENPSGDLCVAPQNSKFYIANSQDKEKFITNLLIPFLFSHSFFEQNNERPWKDYSHGYVGNFEAYIREKDEKQKEDVLKNLFYLKDIDFPLKSLTRENPSFLKLLQTESEEGVEGANKLMTDIKKFKLEKYIK
jgi:hypothetical protein